MVGQRKILAVEVEMSNGPEGSSRRGESGGLNFAKIASDVERRRGGGRGEEEEFPVALGLEVRNGMTLGGRRSAGIDTDEPAVNVEPERRGEGVKDRRALLSLLLFGFSLVDLEAITNGEGDSSEEGQLPQEDLPLESVEKRRVTRESLHGEVLEVGKRLTDDLLQLLELDRVLEDRLQVKRTEMSEVILQQRQVSQRAVVNDLHAQFFDAQGENVQQSEEIDVVLQSDLQTGQGRRAARRVTGEGQPVIGEQGETSQLRMFRRGEEEAFDQIVLDGEIRGKEVQLDLVDVQQIVQREVTADFQRLKFEELREVQRKALRAIVQDDRANVGAKRRKDRLLEAIEPARRNATEIERPREINQQASQTNVQRGEGVENGDLIEITTDEQEQFIGQVFQDTGQKHSSLQ